MKLNDVSVDQRSQRAERFRRIMRAYKVGFYSFLTLLALSEIQFDLSSQFGHTVRFYLNPTSTQTDNQPKGCK